MPRPLARSLTRAASSRSALRAAALTVLTGGVARPYAGRRACNRTSDRAGDRTGRARDRAAAPRPRDYAALAIGAKRAMRAATLRDCGRRCVYCAAALSFDTVTLDHVYPRAHGGPNTAGNVVAACGPCNRLKADLLPSEFFSATRGPGSTSCATRAPSTAPSSAARAAR